MLSTINDVQQFISRGPWTTKSGGNLNVPIGISLEEFKKIFLQYNTNELSATKEDLRGFRIYTINGLKQGVRGAGEFHRLRAEILLVVRGSARWTVEDINGEKTSFALKANQCVFTPPFVMHTYEILENDTTLLVVCNTLFDPDRAETKDTYSYEEFLQLKNRA